MIHHDHGLFGAGVQAAETEYALILVHVIFEGIDGIDGAFALAGSALDATRLVDGMIFYGELGPEDGIEPG